MASEGGPCDDRRVRVGHHGLVYDEPLLFEQGSPGRVGVSLPEPGVPEVPPEELLPPGYVREEMAGFPELSENEVVRHYTRLSQWNHCIDTGFYPLGSCTMKYNPKVNDWVARLPGFSGAHPLQPEEVSQGALELMWSLERWLCEIGGMDRVSLQPAAGAHGELTGMMMIRAYHERQGNPRKKVLLPDSSHGTNPSSAATCGYEVVEVKSDERGCMTPAGVAAEMDEEVAALMVTNPNTLGLFEEDVKEVADVVHAKGGLVYCDGANLNALLGISRPGDTGVDVLHFNLHKTFSTPHGGGGPGAGPVGVKAPLVPYLPVPVVEKDGDVFRLDADMPHSIGKVRSFYGNFAVLVRAYSYIRSMGAANLRRASELAVLNANYLRVKLRSHYHIPYDRPCMHECVISDKLQRQFGVETLDIAKRLIDYGYHPPTVYFPLIVKGAMLIEPTETESVETLDGFVAAMRCIGEEAQAHPELLREAPSSPIASRLDEVGAARRLRLRWAGSDQ